jgi:hypothetical protein
VTCLPTDCCFSTWLHSFFPLYLLISSFKCKHLEIWGNFRICFHFLLFPFLLPPPPIIDKNATYINWTCTCMTVLIKGEALLTIGYTNFSHATIVFIAKISFQWKQILKFPHISKCLHLKDEISKYNGKKLCNQVQNDWRDFNNGW